MGMASQNSTLPSAITKVSQSRCFSLLLAMSSRVYLLFPPRGHEQNKTTYYEVEYTVVLVFNVDEWLIYGGTRAIRQSIPYSYELLIF